MSLNSNTQPFKYFIKATMFVKTAKQEGDELVFNREKI
jgi:hypothetical protein